MADLQRPVVILGRLDGVMTGIRHLRRTQPLETEVIEGLRARWSQAGPGMTTPLSRSRALWNREGLDLGSDEILAQLLDRGSLED